MSGESPEVGTDHCRIKTCDGTALPEHATGLLTPFPKQEVREPLKQDPALLKVVFLEDPTLPLDPDGWPEDDGW